VLLIGAVISTVIYLITAVARRPHSDAPAAPAPSADFAPAPLESLSGTEFGGFRWSLVAKLFAAGLLPILLLAGAVALHLIGPVLTALFQGLLGAGVAYYGAFLLPARLEGSWMRVRGLLGGSVSIVLGAAAALAWARLLVGIAIAMLAVWSLRRPNFVSSPETTEALESEGYLPFGVGLALAAGIVLVSGAMPLVREILLEYSRILRLA
jgi:hypothetical protein